MIMTLSVESWFARYYRPKLGFYFVQEFGILFFLSRVSEKVYKYICVWSNDFGKMSSCVNTFGKGVCEGEFVVDSFILNLILHGRE